MKKILITILLFALTLSLASCSIYESVFNKSETDDENNDSNNDHDDGSKPGSDFKMIAKVTDIAEKIAVDVIESEYTSGIHLVNTAKATEYFDKNGNAISRSEIKVGDTVEILYSGQIMLSYPPQIVAARITVR